MKEKYLHRLLPICLLLSLNFNLKAQSSGDIAFVGFNADGDKDFTIVVLDDITSNTTIYFTDTESDGLGGLISSEGTITWSTGSSIIKAGTIIVFTDVDNSSNPNFGASIGTITRSGSFNLSTSKDGIIAFTGTDESTPTTFIAAIQIGNNSDELGPFDGDGITLTNTNLVIGTSIIIVDNSASPDGGIYHGSRSSQTLYSDYYSLISDSANWTTSTSDGESLLPFSQEAFTTNTTNWTGAVNGVWNVVGNWDNGIPTSSSFVIIPETSNSTAIASITSAEIGNLKLEDTDPLYVFGDLTISGNLTVASGSSLQLESSITATKTIDAATIIINGIYTSEDEDKFTYVTENLSGTNGWKLVSSPTIGQIIDGGANGFATSNALQVSPTNNYGIAPYNNAIISEERWDYFTTAEIAATNNITLSSGKGYSILPSGTELRFKGAIPTNDVSISITDNTSGVGNDFNLIGNPFPSFIPADNTANNANSFLDVNMSQLNEATLWFWDRVTSAYITVNQTSNSFIAPTQGFFVRAKSGGGTVNFTKAMQSHKPPITFNKNENLRPEIKLQLTNNGTTKSTQILYIEDKTIGFDNGYDSSIFGEVDNSFTIFTHTVANGNGKNLAIQSLPNNNFENMIIPVGIHASKETEITISASSINLPTGINVYLEDKKIRAFTELTPSSNFTTTLSSDLNGVGRFYLHTKRNTLNIDAFNLENISMYTSDENNLRVIGIQNGIVKIKIYDILGKQIITSSFLGKGVNNISLPNLKTGIYIVQLENKDRKLNEKIILE